MACTKIDTSKMNIPDGWVALVDVYERYGLEQPLLQYHKDNLKKSTFIMDGRKIRCYKTDEFFMSLVEKKKIRVIKKARIKEPIKIEYQKNSKPKFTPYNKKSFNSYKELLNDDKCTISQFLRCS